MHKSQPSFSTQPARCVVCYSSIWMKRGCARCSDCGFKYHINCEPGLPAPCRKILPKSQDASECDDHAKVKTSASFSSYEASSSASSSKSTEDRRGWKTLLTAISSSQIYCSKSMPDSPAPGKANTQVRNLNGSDRPKFISHYAIHEVMGRGSYGIVRRVVSLIDGQSYAMKEMSHKALQSKRYGITQSNTGNIMDDFKTEIRILRKVRHPNIIQLIEVLDGLDPDRLYFVFELADGVVMQVNNNNPSKPFDTETAWGYFRDLLGGIVYLHSRGIVHRDIKPENLLIKNGVLKICDFGVSEDVNTKSQLKPPKGVGSVCFWAPELCTTDDATYETMPLDVWAMGITLYLFIYGKVPFMSKSDIELFDLIRNSKVELSDDIEDDLKEILLALLDKDPATRPSAQQLLTCSWVTKQGSVPLYLSQEDIYH